jgi:uncharacterized DUF497 family protein
MKEVVWTDYFKYRVQLRGFTFKNVEGILWYRTERYSDTVTRRLVVVGKDGNVLVMIPHEVHEESTITPITNKSASRRPTAASAIAPAAVGRGRRG